ncbi:MAG: hypothetical protein LBQ28_07510 [Prevotellaceae bacterium]|jgi:hypothetical protein|nr:hypothetical protein [Prevotellaceae bacterium]
MRRKFFLAIALPIVAIIAIMACTKDANETNEIKNKENLLSLKSFEKYGQIHNEVLSNVKDNYVIPEGITDYDEAINDINDFIKQSLLQSNLLTNDEKTRLASSTSLDKYKYFVDNRIFVKKVFEKNDAPLTLMSASQGSLDTTYYNDTVNINVYDKLDEVYSLGLIDSFEHKNLKIITDKAYDNITGKINDDDFYDCIVDIADKWEAKGYTQDSPFGTALGVTVAIGIASHEWWEQNPDARLVQNHGGEEAVLQSGPAGDAAGALIGIVKALLTDGNVLSEGVVGAVLGSVGVLGKVKSFFQEVWAWFF